VCLNHIIIIIIINLAQAEFLARFVGFQHICSPQGIFSAKSNETSIGLSSFDGLAQSVD